MSEDNWIVVAVSIFALVGIYLITRRWFWLAVFFFFGLASLFAMDASVGFFRINGNLLHYIQHNSRRLINILKCENIASVFDAESQY